MNTMKKRTLIIAILFITSLFVVYKLSYRHGFKHGENSANLEVAGCTIAMAHEGKCYLPCESYFDCVAKNGHPEREY